jgi:hypothetical protein
MLPESGTTADNLPEAAPDAPLERKRSAGRERQRAKRAQDKADQAARIVRLKSVPLSLDTLANATDGRLATATQTATVQVPHSDAR